MPQQPSLHTELYDAVRPEAIGKENQGKIGVVTGAARGLCILASYSMISDIENTRHWSGDFDCVGEVGCKCCNSGL
jgi:hypothetical protein